MHGFLLAVMVISAAPREVVSAAELTGHMRYLASDLLEGRAPGTRGDRLAQEYIAAQFEALGLAPVSPDGGWVQPVPLVGVTGHPESVRFSAGEAALSLRHLEEAVVVSDHHEAASTLADAPLLFAGYGIVAPEYRWDDFKGVDVAGKVLVVLNSDPEDDPAIFGGRARLWYGRWDYKFEQARRLGAAGCLIIHTTPSAGYPWEVVQASWSGTQYSLPNGPGHRLQLKGWLTEHATRKVLSLAGNSLDALRRQAASRAFRPVPLGITARSAFSNDVSRTGTGNVLGLLRGSDPRLREEVVVYTAHFDHLGRREGGAPGEDVIYNGAVDNASGVAALLSIARAMAALPVAPRRSVLFAAVAAEEQGLLGSQYLVEHPPVPHGRMAAVLNIDGLNIWGRTRDVSAIGLGKSSLDAVLVEQARRQGRTVKPDALADRGFFYRSDQFNFAKVGVPAAYFSSGHDFVGRPESWGRQQRERWEATHYHRPSDEVRPEWDLSGAVEDVALFFEVGRAVADAPTMPTWTKGDEFEAARRRALNALPRGREPRAR